MDINKLKLLANNFSSKTKFKLFTIILLMITSAISELISIGLFLPFLSLMVNPGSMNKYPNLLYLLEKNSFNVKPIVLIAVILLFVNVLTTILRVYSQKVITRFSFEMGHEISLKMFSILLKRPYSYTISNNSNILISGIITKSNAIIYNVIMPLMLLIVSAFNLFGILISIFFIDFLTAIITISLFTIMYLIINANAHKKLINNSLVISSTTDSIHQIVNESIGGIRDVILGGYQDFFINKYIIKDKESRNALSSNYILSTTPRFLMEGFSIVIVCLIVIFSNIESTMLVVTFGVLAMAAQRGLPALNIIYNSLSNIKGNSGVIDDVLKLLESNENVILKDDSLTFKNEIIFDKVSFKYDINGSKFNLKDINLKISKGSNIGIVGSSGSGKSTFTDLLTGLLYPTIGEILIDSIPLKIENHHLWQSKIAYVPQNIFLVDGSFIDNIAFGVIDFDLEKVKYVASIVGLSDYIETLKDDYFSLTGERGASLSGGQIQRIGIARALYKNPEILVLDEATSALDSKSEKFIIDSIIDNSKGTTIIMIAHRVSTLKYCDQIFEFENSRFIGSFQYNEYLNKL
jgi:ABC-type multidrug transport system fused ATPase/permease subunit